MKKITSPQTKETYNQNAEIFKLLGNPIRLEMLELLKQGEMIVTDMLKIIGIRKANASQHLALMRKFKVVKVRRVGKNAYYSLTNSKIKTTPPLIF
jgi:ArsR family transcriptional regulator, zinc-responsive transcriptional repressor